MSKKVKSIIIGFIVLLLLGGAMAALLLMPEKKDTVDEGSSSSELESFKLYETVKADIKSIEVTNESGSYIISRVGEDKYTNEEFDGLKQLDANYASVISSAVSLTSFNKVEENSSKAADFGLEKPLATVKVNTKDKTYVLSLGANSPDNIYTYVMVEGDDAIYAISASSLAYAFASKESYLDPLILEAFNKEDPEAIPTIKGMDIYRKDLETPIKVAQLTAEEKEQANKALLNEYKMVSPIDSAMSTTKGEELIYNLFGLAGNQVIAGKPDEATLAKYGITDDSDRANLRYENNEITFILGDGITKPDSDIIDTHYVYVPENQMIYTVTDASMKWISAQPKELISTIAHLVYIGELSGLELVVEGETHKFDLKTVKDEEDRDVTTAKKDGKEVDIDNFKKLLQLAFDTPISDIYVGEPVAGEAIVSIRYIRTNGIVDEVSMYRVSDRTAVLAVNGVQKYTARLAYVDKLKKEIQNLLDGNPVTVDW